MSRLKELYLGALEVPDHLRTDWLAERCEDADLRSRIVRLLAVEQGGSDWLDEPIASPGLAAAVLVGRSIGGCRVEHLLAVGGMGAVFAATQERPERRVALKLLQPGLIGESMRRRFELEAEVLGRLHHPGIAAVHGAGEVDLGYGPQPYLVMEFVDGRELGRFAAEERPSLRERIGLVLDIAEAMAHAHQQGVIHRDLKPANILVECVDGRPRPRVVDFGIARMAERSEGESRAMTMEGQLLGTLGAMSPEQAVGDPRGIDTRTDVYALGALAYEFWVGRPPIDLDGLSFPKALEAIRETEPRRAGALVGALRGDLETILEKALSKEPARRYASANEFAADLRRHLADEPVLARPASATYRVGRFARRHRMAVAAVVGVVAASLGGTVWALRERDAALEAESRATGLLAEVSAARDLAEDLALEAGRTADFLGGVLSAANPRVLGPKASILDALDLAARQVDALLADQPAVASRVHLALADAFLAAEIHDRAERHARLALELGASSLGTDSTAACSARYSLATLHVQRRDFDAARELLDRNALALVDLPPRDRWLQARGHALRSGIAARENHLDDAFAHLERAAAVDLGGCDPMHRGRIELDLVRDRGRLEQRAGRLAAGIPHLEEVLRRTRALHPDAHDDVASALHELAVARSALGEPGTAIGLLREAVAIREQVLGADHPRLARTLDVLACTLRDDGQAAAAEAPFRQAMQAFEASAPDGGEDLAICCHEYGICLRYLGRHEESLVQLERALTMRRELFADQHIQIAASETEVGMTLLSLREVERAEPHLQEGLRQRRALQGEQHPGYVNALFSAAQGALLAGRHDEAVRQFGTVAKSRAQIYGPGHWLTIQAEGCRAGALADAGRSEEALQALETALDAARAGRAPMTMIVGLLDALALTAQEAGDSEREARYAAELQEARESR